MANPLHDSLFAPHATADTPFLILPDGARLTHAAFVARAARFAHALSGLGLVPGDRVAAQVDKSADALALYAACLRAGLVFLPLNPAYTPAEVDYFVADAAAAILICAPRAAPALAEVAGAHGAQLQTLDTDGSGTLCDLAEGQTGDFPTADRRPDDLAAILYTSGTTGRSKGAMLTHANLLSNAEALVDAWRFASTDVLLHALPIFHTHGLFVATHVMLLSGGAMILLPRFDVDAVIARLPQATTMMGVPTFYTRLLDDPRLTAELVGHMRLVISGSAPMLAETHRRWTARTGQQILERYGMTEASMITSNPYDGPRRPGSVGLPLPGVDLRIRDAAGADLPPGKIGGIEVRGANVFAGYWGRPEKTAEDMRPDGFFITGDLGQQDAEGHVTIVGRAKDMVISGGLNIYPVEVEAAIDALPGVRESAVIGVPHPDLGEAPVAVVVAVAAEPGQGPDPAAILHGLQGRLARFKHPRHVVIVADLPRNTMGKVQKAALRARFAGLFA